MWCREAADEWSDFAGQKANLAKLYQRNTPRFAFDPPWPLTFSFFGGPGHCRYEATSQKDRKKIARELIPNILVSPPQEKNKTKQQTTHTGDHLRADVLPQKEGGRRDSLYLNVSERSDLNLLIHCRPPAGP